MYLSHFKLKAKPFQMSTDPKFFWLGEKHKEALAILKYGIFENKGVLAVTGDVGTGKTTLINALLKDLGKDIIVATIYDPGLESLEFFNLVAVALDMGVTFKNKGQFLIHFRQFLQKARQQNRKVLLIIDEAQRIGPELLEEARLLSNLEAEHIRLLNIFFIGQNEFVDILQQDINRALRQRIAISYDIKPLTIEETTAYVNHRLRVAGGKTPIFTQGAIQEIFAFSSGYPRLINIICDHALLSGFVKGVQSIDGDIVRECKRELHVSEWGSRHDKDVERENVIQGQKQNIPVAQNEEPSDEQDGVRLARGLYRKAPVTKPDKMPVGLAILSVALILLIAGVVGYVYFKPEKKSTLPVSMSLKKEEPSSLSATDSKEDGKYLVPFIPESESKTFPHTNEGVETASDPGIKVVDQSPFQEITSKETTETAGELDEIKDKKEDASMVLAAKEPALPAIVTSSSDSIKKTIPKAEKPDVQPKKERIKPQSATAKDASRSMASSRKDDQTIKPVVPKKTASRKKVLPKDEKLTAHVDQGIETGVKQNKSVAPVDEPKVLEKKLESRLKAFLASYARAYENRKLDQFAAFFTPDAKENGRPFAQLLPKYRRNFEIIEALDYDIKMRDYSTQTDTGLISVDGTYAARAKLAGGSGEWKQISGEISMALVAYGDTYRIKRLDAIDRSPKAAIVPGDDLLTRLNAFLKDYSSAYENKRLDEFATFFAADATEKGEPFHSLLPKYRQNFEKIDIMDYRIDLKRYSVLEGSGLIRLEGVANLRTKFTRGTGVWRENNIGIFMELAAYGDSFRIKRLDY